MRPTPQRPPRAVLSALATVTACLALAVLPGAAHARPATDEEPPPGVEQILPRGGIPAIVDPTFVPASEADLPDDAWVLGVEMEGEARAYSLNLLNRHEVVNDEVAGTAFAAVW